MSSDDPIGHRIGPLRILGILGRGGMGAVYRAFDERLQREVALKSIRWERADRESRARFLREARILSQLRHPHICTVHGLLEDEEGDHLVLELVQGRDLKRALEDGLDATARWRVAEQLAEALEVAHARGIVHRDLKPENLMVDQDGNLKVLDFGLAQIVGEAPRPLEDRHDETATVRPGSENSSGAGAAGVAAAPVESGTPGADESRSASRSPTEGAPSWWSNESSWIETQKGSVFGTAAFMSPEQARGEPTSSSSDLYSAGLILHRLFTGKSPYGELALPRILVEASEGRTQRVSGVDPELAELIEEMKAPRPENRPPAAELRRRLRRIREKPARRWRRLGIGAAVLAVLLGVGKYTVDLQRERNRAMAAQEAEEASRREAERVVDLLVEIFEGARPGDPAALEKTSREILSDGVRNVRDELAAEPLLRARLLATLGEVQCRLGAYEEGEALLRESLEERRRLVPDDDRALSESLDHLGHCLWFQDRYEEAEEHLVEAVERSEAVGDDEAHKSRNNLALVYWRQARYDEAATLHHRNLAYLEGAGDRPLETARTLNNLGEIEKALGRLEESERLLRRALALKEAELGGEHAEVSSTLNNLASVLLELERFEEGERLYRRALAIEEATYGTDHPRLSSILNNLGTLLDESGRPEEAVPLLHRARNLVVAAHGPAHVRVGIIDTNLGDLFARQERWEEAAEAYRAAVEVMTGALGEEHPHLGYPLYGLARVAEAEGDLEGARERVREVLELRVAALGEEHPLTVGTREALEELSTGASVEP